MLKHCGILNTHLYCIRYWLVSYQLDPSKGHLRIETLNGENGSISLACKQVCGRIFTFLIDKGDL